MRRVPTFFTSKWRVELVAGEGGIFLDGDGEAEPAWISVLARYGEDENVFQWKQGVAEIGEVGLATLDEAGELGDLRDAERGLHVGRFEVIADVRVGVFVVVAAGQGAELPVEALAAGIVDAGLAPAIAPPVAEAVDQDLQGGFVGEDGSAFSHGDVVGRIKTYGGDIAEGSNLLSLEGGNPSASQQSSTSQRLYFLQNADTASTLNTFPRVWAIMTAPVFSLRASSRRLTSISYVGSVTSRKTGTRRF